MSNDKYELINYYSEFCLLLEEYKDYPLINNLTTALLTDITSQNSSSENLYGGGSNSGIEEIDSSAPSSAPVETEGVVAGENIQPEKRKAAIKIQSLIRGKLQRAKTKNFIAQKMEEEEKEKKREINQKRKRNKFLLINKFSKEGYLSRHISMSLLKLEKNIEKGEKPNSVVFYIEDYFEIIKKNLKEEVNEPDINKVFYLLYFIKNFFFGLFKIFSYLKNTSEQEDAALDSAEESGEKKKKKSIRKKINLINLLFNSESNNSVKLYYSNVFDKYFRYHYEYKRDEENELLFKDDFENEFKEIFSELPKIFQYKLENLFVKVLSFFYNNDLNEHFNDKKRKENAIVAFDRFFSDYTFSQNQPIFEPETLEYFKEINQELREVILDLFFVELQKYIEKLKKDITFQEYIIKESLKISYDLSFKIIKEYHDAEQKGNENELKEQLEQIYTRTIPGSNSSNNNQSHENAKKKYKDILTILFLKEYKRISEDDDSDDHSQTERDKYYRKLKEYESKLIQLSSVNN